MWFIIAISSFFLLALAAVIDKFLLSKTRIMPVSFAFYISLGGVLASFLLFFEHELSWPVSQLGVLILGGAALFFGLYFMFLAVEAAEVSKANPLVVSFTPIFVWLLSLFLGLELINSNKILGIIFIVIGGYFLSQVGSAKIKLTGKVWLLILLASLMMGVSSVYSKIAYENLSFLTAFVALRWFTFITAVIFVTLGKYWSKIFMKQKQAKESVTFKSALTVMIIGQAAGSLGVILNQYAIALGNVIVVTSLSGVQFFFVIFLAYLLSKFYPRVLHEDVRRQFFLPKIIWSAVLFVGVALILI